MPTNILYFYNYLGCFINFFQNFQLLNLTKHKPGMLKYIIHTKVGDGPKILKDFDSHLLNEAGLPKITM